MTAQQLRVCYVPGCKNLASESCEDCGKPICSEDSRMNRHMPGYVWRCPECHMKAQSAYIARLTEAAKLALGVMRAKGAWGDEAEDLHNLVNPKDGDHHV